MNTFAQIEYVLNLGWMPLTFILFFAINCSLFSPCVPKHFKLSLSDHDSLFVGNLLFSAISNFVKRLWVYEKLTFVRFTLLRKKRCSITLINIRFIACTTNRTGERPEKHETDNNVFAQLDSKLSCHSSPLRPQGPSSKPPFYTFTLHTLV